MKINFFEYKKIYNSRKKNFLKIFDRVCSKGAFILQKDLSDFEINLQKFQNIKYSVGVNDGTTALILSLIANNIGKDDEVILPSHTYIASAAAVKLIGAKPVFADISLDDNLIDPDSVKKKITKKTRAIMPVHVNGRICNMKELSKIAKSNNLKIIEDGAQSIGAKRDGKPAGYYGNCSTLSFYPAKVLGCFGDGGAVLTNDKKIYEKIKLLRDHGRNKNGNVELWGYNARLDNIQAAILNYKMTFLKDEINTRRKIANIYHNELSSIKNLILPPFTEQEKNFFDVFQNYELRAEQRNKLNIFLLKNGIKTLVQWSGKPVHQIKKLNFNKTILPNTDKFFKECLMLPIHTFLTDRQVMYVVKKIKEFYLK